MNRKRRSRSPRLAPLGLLALFLAYQVSVTAFTHAHIVNGVMIVHSHPSSDKHHTHTAGQVITIACLSTLQGLEAGPEATAEAGRPVLRVLEYPADTFCAHASHVSVPSLRAPPSCC